MRRWEARAVRSEACLMSAAPRISAEVWWGQALTLVLVRAAVRRVQRVKPEARLIR
jgi:hypothetical protein